MDEVISIQSARRLGRQQLEPQSETASLDVQVLLAHFLGQSKAWVLAHPEFILPETIQEQFQNALQRLSVGVPLPYILGRWEFYGRMFEITPDVLIPRPETEGLIEQALAYLDRLGRPGRMIDVGTGSGCIAVTLAAERPSLQVIATDRSPGALRVAKRNARLHSVAERIAWIQCDLLDGIRKPADLILANLPYIPSTRLEHLAVAAYEPQLALNGGVLGLDLIVRLIDQLPDQLNDRGVAILEIDESHARAVVEHMEIVFPGAQIAVFPDLSQQDRYVVLSLENDR